VLQTFPEGASADHPDLALAHAAAELSQGRSEDAAAPAGAGRDPHRECPVGSRTPIRSGDQTARERGWQAVALAIRHGLEDRPILATAFGSVAGMTIWMSEFDEGEHWLVRAWEAAEAQVEPAAAMHLHAAAGMLNAARGRHQSALDLLTSRVGPSIDRARTTQHDELSPTELRVLRYLPTNLTRRETARQLYVSVSTVNTHIGNIYSKLGARDRSSAVQRARELRLLSAGRS
jgi:DNA-binding CsgD family transcriptional regulator